MLKTETSFHVYSFLQIRPCIYIPKFLYLSSVIQKLFIIYKLCQNKRPKTCKIPKYFLLVPWLLYKVNHNIVLKGSVHLIQYMWKWILKHQPRGIMTGHGSSCVLMILLLHLTCKQFLKWGRRATKQKNHPQKILKCWREAIRAFLKNELLPATKMQWFFWDQSKIAYEEKSYIIILLMLFNLYHKVVCNE